MPRLGRHQRRTYRLLALAWLALGAAGCQTAGTSVLERWRMARDTTLTRPINTEKDDRSMMARWLNPQKPKASDPNAPPSLILGPNGWNPKKIEPNPAADAEFKAAEQLYQKGQLEEAEEAFSKIAKSRKDTPWGEKGQFFLAETQYQEGKLVAAHDSYEKLISIYPGTQYLDKLVAREYAIGQKWIGQYDKNVKNEDKMPWYGRFNGQRPLLDTNGHAIAALEHVRHHDPNGPLSDDAVLRIADHHFENADYESAALFYDQLIRDHPKSPFLQRAQLSTIDSKMKGYLGPDYDGAGLDEAREMVKQTMALFPERQTATTDKLYHTIDLISDQQAERTYMRGDYYRRTGHVNSAEYYFAMIPYKWPTSPWAAKAKTQLAKLAKMPRKEALPSKIMTTPGSSDPFSGSSAAPMNAMNGMGGMGMPGMGMGGMGMY